MSRSLPTIIIPAYQPEPVLLELVQVLCTTKKLECIIVDDGSSDAYASLFQQIDAIPSVHVLRHAVNLGKGQALKTAFNYFLLHSAKRSPGVITADADGQHKVEDILLLLNAFAKQSERFWLGARAFTGGVPLRSKFGNSLTRKVFSLFVGKHLQDTQTGLRGIPRELMRIMLSVPSMGYEFELEMLIKANEQGFAFEELPIETIYEEDNQCSHFNPLVDSLKIYFVFLRFSAISIMTSVLDFFVFFLAYTLVSNVLVSTLISRFVAGGFNFTCAKLLVFKSKGELFHEGLKYVFLVLSLMLVSYGFIILLIDMFGFNVYLSKIISEGLLFVGSFAIQKIFVFRKVS